MSRTTFVAVTSPRLQAQILAIGSSLGRAFSPRATPANMYKSVHSHVGIFKGSPADFSKFLGSSKAALAAGGGGRHQEDRFVRGKTPKLRGDRPPKLLNFAAVDQPRFRPPLQFRVPQRDVRIPFADPFEAEHSPAAAA